jgi:RNA polymerase sigma-70 factor (ECF subfamily)
MVPATIDEKKFLALYDQYVTKIYRYIYFRVGSEQLAQDLASEGFLRTWQYLKEGKYIGNFSAMIYKVCRNLVADYFRKNSKLPISLDELKQENNQVDELASDIDIVSESDQNLEIEHIKACLCLIKEEYQEVIIWRYIEDFSVEEISQITERSEGSIRTLLSRAISALRLAVEKQGF